MPTYQYLCNECDHAFESVQSFSEDSLTTCPECGKSIRKIYSNVGIVFKGSGFYKTDSRASQKKAATASAATNSTSSSSTATGESNKSAASAGTASSSAPAASTTPTSPTTTPTTKSN